MTRPGICLLEVDPTGQRQGAPAARRPVGSGKPKSAGETPALPGSAPRFRRGGCLVATLPRRALAFWRFRFSKIGFSVAEFRGCDNLLKKKRAWRLHSLSGQRHVAGRADHRQGISAGVSGEPEKLAHTAFDLHRDGPNQAGRGHDAGFPRAMSARKNQLARRGDFHPRARRPHHGHGRLPAVLRFARGGRCRFMRTRRRWTHFKRVFVYAFHRRPWPRVIFNPEPPSWTGPFALGDLEIMPLDLPHGAITTTAFLFLQDGKKRLAYLSDCKEIPPAAGKSPRRGNRRAGRAAAQAASDPHEPRRGADGGPAHQRGRTFFTHLTHDYDHDQAQAELPPGVTFAHDGLKVASQL